MKRRFETADGNAIGLRLDGHHVQLYMLRSTSMLNVDEVEVLRDELDLFAKTIRKQQEG